MYTIKTYYHDIYQSTNVHGNLTCIVVIPKHVRFMMIPILSLCHGSTHHNAILYVAKNFEKSKHENLRPRHKNQIDNAIIHSLHFSENKKKNTLMQSSEQACNCSS